MTELREFAVTVVVVLPFYLTVAVLVIYGFGRYGEDDDSELALMLGTIWPITALVWVIGRGLRVLRLVYKRGLDERV